MSDSFFPPAAFYDEQYDEQLNKKLNSLMTAHFSKHLEAMAEPSLWVLANDRNLHAYRFLWLRTFDQPVAVRLHINQRGEGELTAKATDGEGGYEPGQLEFNQTSFLSQRQVSAFLIQLQELQFWSLPTQESSVNPDGSGWCGLDGARWILEGAQGGKYHVLNWWSPDEGAFKQTALMLVRLAHITVQDIY